MMDIAQPVWAVVPVKETASAKQRLAGALSADVRKELALAMCEDVLSALAAVDGLAGIAVVTVDAAAAAIASSRGAEVWTDGACEDHTGAVAAAARLLAARGCGILTVPADIPLVQPSDIEALLSAPTTKPRFVIVPARDRRGSNAILCAPAGAVPLRFGDDSFHPHLAAAQAWGAVPATLDLPRIALDIDRPDDLAALLRAPGTTRAHAVLARHGVMQALEDAR